MQHETCYWGRAWGNSSSGVNDYGDEIWFCTSSSPYDFGIVNINTTYSTGICQFYFKNCGATTGNVTISGSDMTGTGTDWELSEDDTNGADIVGLSAGLCSQTQTMTFYPDAHSETSSVDGYAAAWHIGAQTWAHMWDSVGDKHDDQDVTAYVRIIGEDIIGDRFTEIARSIVVFDTSGLPNDAVISSANNNVNSAVANKDE